MKQKRNWCPSKCFKCVWQHVPDRHCHLTNPNDRNYATDPRGTWGLLKQCILIIASSAAVLIPLYDRLSARPTKKTKSHDNAIYHPPTNTYRTKKQGTIYHPTTSPIHVRDRPLTKITQEKGYAKISSHPYYYKRNLHFPSSNNSPSANV
jgi:hypothetical protein